MKSEVSKEQVDEFLKGSNPQERIIKVECANNESKVHVIYVDKNGTKRIQEDSLYPFCWAKQDAGRAMFGGNRQVLKDEMKAAGIACKGLRTTDSEGKETDRMRRGYRVMFYATKPMSYTKFLNFFKKAGTPIYGNNDDDGDDKRDFMVVSAVEQYLITTGKRFFKGYDNYDDLYRCQWDLETEGLDPLINMISQIGIRTNRGFEKIITIEGQTREEKYENELNGIIEMFNTFRQLRADIISGHNTENFDWNFINVRLQQHGLDMKSFSEQFLPKGVYKKDKESVLKLGGEVEYYYPTVMWGTNLTDSLFAVRRAQALDSSMKKSNLKYVTKYSKINKPNRVYVPGKEIDTVWLDTEPNYAFNDENGHWFKITDKIMNEKCIDNNVEINRYEERDGKFVDYKENVTYDLVTGRYIVQRYLLDDLWETDKIECRYNESNFLVGKMLPVSFEKMCTMGTAAIWKYIMMAWSYEHGLAIPELIPSRKFTGGLSRLLSVGYNPDVVKLDYNSLYPSIILTYGIASDIDIMGAMSAMLDYILTQREYYKGLKAEYGAKAKKFEKMIKETLVNMSKKEIADLKNKQEEAAMLAARNDKLQLPLKITGNGFFGSYGSGQVFPWSDIICAEETTCIGRQALRLMIGHFSNIGTALDVTKNIDDVEVNDILYVKTCDGKIIKKSVKEIENDTTRNYYIKTSEGWKYAG